METPSRDQPLSKVVETIDGSLPRFCELIHRDSFLEGEDPRAVIRTSHCGPVSGLLMDELLHSGIEAEYVSADIRDLRIFDDDQRSHVQCRFWADGQPYRLDATYQQFLSLFGMHYRHENFRADHGDNHLDLGGDSPASIFPQEQYVIVADDTTTDVGVWAAAVVSQFWQNFGNETGFQVAHNYTYPDDGLSWGTDLRRQPSSYQVEAYFNNIFSKDRYKTVQAPESIQALIGKYSLRSAVA